MRFYTLDVLDHLKSALSRLKIGSNCAICARKAHARPDRPVVDLCDSCESLFIRTRHRDRRGYISWLCPGCGDEIPVDQSCPGCLAGCSLFSRIVAPYRYDFPVDHLIHSLKYRDQRHLARLFGSLLAQSVLTTTPVGSPLPTHLVPVPLHGSRARARGYNQSADMARWCAHDLGIRWLAHAVGREFDTGSLAGLSRAERQHRILGAFRADPGVAGRHLAIVDDVLTTGSTAREMARELYDTGAESVELWVLARTSSTR